MNDVYLELDPTGPYITGLGTATPTEGALSVAIPGRLAPVATLEATHTFDGDVVLHDHRELGDDVPWRLRCRQITLGSAPAATLPADPRVGGTGTIGRRGTLGGRIVTYSGAIQAIDAAALREGSQALLAACWDVSDDRPVHIDQDDAGWVFYGRPVPNVADNTSLPLSAVPTPYQCEFTVAFQLNDPRIYYSAPFVESTVIDGEAPAGAATLPWPRLPVVLRPPIPTTATGTVEILGRIPTGITLRVHGPRAGITITDLDRDVQLVLGVEIPGGSYLDVDLRAATVTDPDGQEVRGAITWPDSTWWSARNLDVRPGLLRLRMDSETVGVGASLDVIYSPAYA